MQKREIYRAGVRQLLSWMGQTKGSTLSVLAQEELYPVYPVATPYGQLRMYCPNEFVRWRAQSFLSKEPETLEWIDSIPKGETFLDIGANVGVYTLYAIQRGLQTISVEPESMNFQILNQNLFLNFPDRPGIALCLAVADANKISCLSLSQFKAGAALHMVAENKTYQVTGSSSFQQGVMTVTLDWLTESLGVRFPQHIKVDVDGNEKDIITGGARTLADQRLKSFYIELDDKLPSTNLIIRQLEACGLTLSWKRHSPAFDGGKYESIYNFLFRRSPEGAVKAGS